MDTLDHWLEEWAVDVLRNVHKSGHPPINAVEKILRDPGISSMGARHKILWWPRNRRIAKISRAMHQIDSISQVCLLVDYGKPVNDDGTIYELKHLVRSSSLTMRNIKERTRKAKRKLRSLINLPVNQAR